MPGNRAPRDAVLHPCRRQERIGGRPLGHPIHLKAKARGDKSMSEKQGVAEDAYDTALQGPCDTAKATLPESQSPAVEPHTPRHATASMGDAARSGPFTCRGSFPLLGRRSSATRFKGMRGAPTSRSTRSAPPERGMAYGARALGSRSPRSSLRWGKPITWRRGTGRRQVNGEGCAMHASLNHVDAAHWRAA